jgi:Matrixin
LLFPDQYIMAAHSSSSSSKHKAKGDDATIEICCSWGKEIDDGILTYRIDDDDDDDDDANPQVIQAVHQAVDEWNSKVPNIQLQEITDSNADIDIKTKSKAPKVTHSDSIDESRISAGKDIKFVQPGEAQTSFNSRGFITHVDITISTKALGNAISLSGLQSIVKHEIGHAYGIGHTNFIGDLMSPVLTGGTNTDISQCHIDGIEEANTSPPHARAPQFLRC